MSVVVSNRIASTPVLYGDILISSETPASKIISVPTIPDLTYVLDISVARQIHGFCRKLCRVRNDVVIGWVGSLDGAKLAINDLDKYLPDSGTVTQDIEGILCLPGFADNLRVQLLIWFGPHEATCVFWDSDHYSKLNRVELPYAIGSGESHFRTLQEADGIALGSDIIGRVINGATEILSFELIYGTNLVDFWGGFVEAVYLKNGRYKFAENYVLYTFVYREQPNGGFEIIPHPFIFIPYYSGNTLILYRADMAGENSMTYIVDDIRHWHPGNTTKTASSSFRNPDYHCFAAMFRHIDGGNSPISFSFPASAAEDYVKIDCEAGVLRISFSKKLFELLVSIGKDIQKECNQGSNPAKR